MNAKQLSILVRREFWEHRVLWLAPLTVAILLVLCAFPAHVETDVLRDGNANLTPEDMRRVVFAVSQWALTLPQYLVMVIVLTFYLLDCLFAERKDRSILFWKSLPVSDGATVISKLLVALIVVPLGVFALALVTGLLFTAVWYARVAMGQIPTTYALWDTVVWFKVQGFMLLGILVAALWYAPLAAYLMLVSAWARRAPMLWAVLPPVLAIIVERVAFGTHYIASLIQYRSWSFWRGMHLKESLAGSFEDPGAHVTASVTAPQGLHLLPYLTNVDVWLGLAVAVGFAFAATRLRRYRDDT